MAAVVEHAPAYRDLPLTTLGAGLDHHAFGVGDLVVRVGAPGAAVTREAALLRLVTGRIGIAVPKPRFADPARGVLAYRLLPGPPAPGSDTADRGCGAARADAREAARHRPGRGG